jgi:16S rRNA (cytosine967-C5)-methyltransferase
MRLAGRMAAAIEILQDMEERHRPVSLALKNWGLAHRFAGSGDRAAIGNMVYDALRQKASLGYIMGSDSPRALVLGVVVLKWGQDIAQLQEIFASDNFAPSEITKEEIERLETKKPLVDAPDFVIANIAEWLKPSFVKAFGENWIDEAKAFTKRPPLDLRINELKSKADRVEKALKRFNSEGNDLLPFSLRIEAGEAESRTPNVTSDEAFKKGWFEVQDLGSQIVAALIDAQPKEQLLDYCAGAGGKTLSLSAQMKNSGQIFAYDIDRHRIAPIHERIKRNGVRNVQIIEPESEALKAKLNKMDKVVVDAPCTGTGTWRRRPDTKWKLTQEQLDNRLKDQAEILEAAAKYVRPGGQLSYITCSILPQENDEQIEAFLKKNKNFTAIASHSLWQKKFGSTSKARPYFGKNGITLTPASTKSDGFFISILERDIIKS